MSASALSLTAYPGSLVDPFGIDETAEQPAQDLFDPA